MHKEMFALVDQKHQDTDFFAIFLTATQLNNQFFPRPAVPNPLANANLN